MSVYPEVPEWWYMIILLAAIGLGLISILNYPTHTTVGALFMGIALAVVFIVPVGVIYAVTNTQVTLNVLSEFIGGLLFPGNALAMNMFKSYGFVTTSRAITFAQDLKLGHYSKIPPRIMFIGQTIATIVSTCVAMAILNWQVTGIKGVCTPEAQAKFYCPGTSTFFTASVIWGTLGPSKMYGRDGPYFVLIFGFLIGAVFPIPFYLLAKKFPNSKLIRSFHVPVFLAVVSAGLRTTCPIPGLPSPSPTSSRSTSASATSGGGRSTTTSCRLVSTAVLRSPPLLPSSPCNGRKSTSIGGGTTLSTRVPTLGLVFLASSLPRGLDLMNHTGDPALVSSNKRSRSCICVLERCDVRFNADLMYLMLGLKTNGGRTPTELFGRRVLDQSLHDTYRSVIIDSFMTVICIHDTLCRQRVS
jgi:hypothetical protein